LSGELTGDRKARLLSGPDGRMRWGWRLLLFVSLVFAIAAVFGGLTIWLVGPPPDESGTLFRGLLIGLLASLAASWVMMSAVESRSLRRISSSIPSAACLRAACSWLEHFASWRSQAPFAGSSFQSLQPSGSFRCRKWP
jgi:hypothetical protein